MVAILCKNVGDAIAHGTSANHGNFIKHSKHFD
jgi:hypothetical protein